MVFVLGKFVWDPVCSTAVDFNCIDSVKGAYGCPQKQTHVHKPIRFITGFEFVWQLLRLLVLTISVFAAKVEEQLIYAYYDDSEEQRSSKSTSTSCHPSCNDFMYSSQVFYSDLIKEPGNEAPEWGRPKP